MNVTIDFGPQLEEQLFAMARQNGIAPAEVIKKVMIGDLPPLQNRAKISKKNEAAIAMLRSWRTEDATDDPDEVRAAEEELTDFKRNINRNRMESGEGLVYPE